jgi:16S rRNA (adenine1518-N6/adenine1519-N6)-dimethyltransferase
MALRNLSRHHARSEGIGLKKAHGQHFLRLHSVVANMLAAVTVDQSMSILEVGPGDGFLTSCLLSTKARVIRAYEIDKEWADLLRSKFTDPRLQIVHKNFLEVTVQDVAALAPIVVLANLPYHVTFPILKQFHAMSEYIREGVIMVQEEVAQRLVALSGRDRGPVSLYYQEYFVWQLLDKVPPSAFLPPPAVVSRLVYFRPKTTAERQQIPHEEEGFWAFAKVCFQQPRRTIRNNMMHAAVPAAAIPEGLGELRAQQLTREQIMQLWLAVKDTRRWE